MRRIIFSLVMTAALVPAALNAQASATGAATGRATAMTSADAAADARINATIEKSVKAGMPRSDFDNKVAEGRAKGASSARIASVVEHRAESMSRVQAALEKGDRKAEQTSEQKAAADGSVTTAAELVAATDAFQNGVSLSSIINLSAGAGANRGLALSVLADLVAGGRTAPSQAVVRVQSAIQAGGNALSVLSASAAATGSIGGHIGH